MTIVINKNIPLIESNANGWGRPMSPDRKEMETALEDGKMEIGDSFLLPDELVTFLPNGYPQAKANVRATFIKHGMKCATRSTGTGVRVWRTH